MHIVFSPHPVPGPWIHGAVIHQLETGLGEKDNTEMDAFLLTLAHLVLRADRDDVMEECGKVRSRHCGSISCSINLTVNVIILIIV